jgi:class 3 adenylate cyclase
MTGMSSNEELANNIDKTRKQITTLFTDIVDSSRYWDQFGDVRGRMMIDHHNRLVFPVIRKFHGRIVKTIGDGLMAVFKNPNDALMSAVAIQQILQKMRNADNSFHVHVRIGIHTGVAIVEKNDVYGDAINVAKRVESFGGIDEIVLSEVTAELVRPGSLAFHKKGSFVPKGKTKPMTVYRCRWGECKDLTHGLKASSDIPLDAREKGDIAAHTILLLLVASMLYQIYGRYLLADGVVHSLHAQLLALNPLLLFSEYSFLAPALSAVVLTAVLILIRIRTAPSVMFRVFKGIAGFGLAFLLVYAPVRYFSVSFATAEGNEIFKSEGVFIRAAWPDLKQHLRLPLSERNWYTVFDTQLIIPADNPGITGKDWLRKISRNNSAAPLSEPPMVGVWSMRNVPLRTPAAFYFRLFDLCAICAGIVGFVLGFMNFTIRPS